MHYIVEDIEFDFGDENITFDDEIAARDTALGLWYIESAGEDIQDELIEKITDTTGWCVKSIQYCENRPHKLTSYM
tara:strand:- start:219 stop:446 length:228 start_codon:yes stop_codon:yes gene_type:complete